MESIKKIILLFKTHLDVGFTDYAENIVNQYMTIHIPKALQIAKDLRERGGNERFIWTTGSWLIDKYLEEADEQGSAQMRSAILAGDISWHALPFTMHTELMDQDLFHYGLRISKNLDKAFGRNTIAAKFTDVPGDTAAIVPLLSDAGVELLHIGVNPASMPPDVPDLFVWRPNCGLGFEEQKDIVVMYNKGYYGEFAQIPNTQTAVCFAHTNDNCGPQHADEIIELYHELYQKYPDAEIIAADLNAVAEAIRPVRDSLPVVTCEIGDTWAHGNGSDPRKVSQYRALLRVARQYGVEDAEKIYKHLLCIPEHTWGMDEKTFLQDHTNFMKEDFNRAVSTPKYLAFQKSWEEQRAYNTAAIDALHGVVKETAVNEAAGYQKQPADVSCYTKVEDLQSTIQIGAYSVKFGGDGRIVHLSCGDRNIADPQHSICGILYEAFSQKEYDRFLDQYLTNRFDWAIEDFGKTGCGEAISEYCSAVPKLEELYKKDNTLLAKLSLDGAAADLYGAPRRLELSAVFEENRIVLDVSWYDKDATRVAEALWFSFHPAFSKCYVRKLGRYIDVCDVVSNGGRHLHGTDFGVKLDNFTIESLDAALVSPGRPKLLDFDNTMPDLSEGVYFNLYNNIWGTNFPMWYHEDARFRFILNF